MLDSDLFTRLGPQVPPTAVRDYAKSRGWQPAGESRRRLWIFRHAHEELRQLIIPMDQDASWVEALQEVVLRLAEAEQRPTEAILDNLLTLDSDTVRFRVSGDEAARGMLPVSDAVGLIDGAKRALMAAACSVNNRVTHHPRMSRSETEEFMRICRMGQTEIGSFVVKIVCPLNAMDELPLLQLAQPFAREATTILLKGCQRIIESIERDNVDAMLEENSGDPTVTSNLCEALLRMHAAREKADLSVEVAWSGAAKQTVPSLPSVASFKSEYFRTVEEIGRHLRPERNRDEEGLLLGTVETLNGDVGDDGRRSGEVVFSLLLPDEEIVRARGNLNAEDYERAVHAHERGRGYVSFSGTLRRGIRVGRVEGIEGLQELSSQPKPHAESGVPIQ